MAAWAGPRASAEFDQPQITGPVLRLPPSDVVTACQGVERCAALQAPEHQRRSTDSLKHRLVTWGALGGALLAGYTAWQAVDSVASKAAAARQAATTQHDHDDRAHPGLRALIERQGAKTDKTLDKMSSELTEIHRLLSLQPRRRKR